MTRFTLFPSPSSSLGLDIPLTSTVGLPKGTRSRSRNPRTRIKNLPLSLMAAAAATISIRDHELPFDTHNLYDVTISTSQIHTLLTHTPSMVDQWILSHASSPSIVGLDVEWRPNRSVNSDNPVAILQLCVAGNCLVFQILHAPSVPTSLARFLSGEDGHVFVGVGIAEDAERLICDYDLKVGTAVDLREVAEEKTGKAAMRGAGLNGIAKEVLGLQVAKPNRVRMGRWDSMWLSSAQVQYACVDAFLAYEIARVLGLSASV